MAETSENPPPSDREAAPSLPPSKTFRKVGNPAAPRRVAARKHREQRQQRIVVVVTATTITLALFAILSGLTYDRLWVPSRPLARTGNVTLTRGDYWTERKLAYAREVLQNFQLLAVFGGNPQLTQKFQGQSPTINGQIKQIRTAEVDVGVVGQWETRQLKVQAASSRGVSVTDDAVNQAIVKDLGLVFLPPPTPAVTTTATVGPTADPAATLTATATPAATATLTATVTPAATATLTATATPGGPTATTEPTMTPLPTPVPAEAVTQVGLIVDEIYRRYEMELAVTAEKPVITKDEFRAALVDQYREQVINERIEAQLVPSEGFAYSQTPTKVKARQVLVAVTPPAGATPDQLEEAFAAAKSKADALVATLRGGAAFATVAAASSDDPGSRAQGGDMGLFDQNGVADNGATYPPELVKQAFTLAQDVLSAPIRTQFGWHVITVTARELPPEDQQLREARTKALDAWLAEQRTLINVARFPEPTPTLTAAPTVATPSTVPTFVAGPPTITPTPIFAPTVTPTEAVTVTAILTGTAIVTPTATTAVLTGTTIVPTLTVLPLVTPTP